MADPLKKLATAIDARIKMTAAMAAAGLHAELGTVTEKGIKLDRFDFVIDEYLILDYMKMDFEDDPGYFTTTELDEQVDPPEPFHKIQTPDGLKPLKTGDRVLLIPVNNGQDFVVVGRVVSNG